MKTSPTLHREFFFRAGQFRRAYEKLTPDREYPDWPKYLLFYHAMELALKAYLIQCGVSEEDLKYKFGHDIKKLVEAVNRGLSLPYGSKEMIADVGGRSTARDLTTAVLPLSASASLFSPPVGPALAKPQFHHPYC